MKTLIAFSGGLDSTFLAWRILNETSEELHGFYLDLSHITYLRQGQEHRYYNDLCAAEMIVAPRVVAWLSENVRKMTFEVIKNVKADPLVTVMPGATSRGWRVIPMLKTAAKLVVKGNFDRFVYGKSPENIRTPGQADRDAYYQELWQKLAPGTDFETPLIADKQGRPHALAALPEELLKILLTCNDPKMDTGEPVKCGGCEKCHLTMEARLQLRRGRSAGGILDDLLKRRKAGEYVGTEFIGEPRFGAGRMPLPFPTFDKAAVERVAKVANHTLSYRAPDSDKS